MPSDPQHLRLGVNIDHVATLRNARGGKHPDTLQAALLAQEMGADGITVHLREDRRHIRDEDVVRLKRTLKIPINLEVAATPEMQAFALTIKPHACCIVPEKREERTTEGGLDVASQETYLKKFIAPLTDMKIRVSLFIAPDEQQVAAAARAGAPVIELHTGQYAEMRGDAQKTELKKLRYAAAAAAKLGLEVHAGHGLNFDNVQPIAAIPEIRELNIGHFIMGEAIFRGLGPTLKEMRKLMHEARGKK